MTVRPPAHKPAPRTARLAASDAPIDLVALAEEVARRHLDEFPDERERYGEAGADWCRHDNQYLLFWAVGARNGMVDLERELGWLADVLSARGYPVERLARDLETAADVVRERLSGEERAIAGELAAGARFVRSR